MAHTTKLTKKVLQLLIITALLITRVTSQRDEWCEGGHDHEDDEEPHPHPEDFLVEIFHLYGDNSTCTIMEGEYEHLLEDLGIGGGTHAPHSNNEDHKRKKRSVDHTCYDGHDLLHIFNITEEVGITQSEFIEMSPAFVQQIVQGCAVHSEPHEPPSAGETWGYGILAVTVVSACAPLGLILAKFRHTSAYKFILTVMLGLAVGTLLSDSLMHLIPHSIGIHGGDDHEHGEGVESFVWKTFVSSLTVLAFFNLQMILQYFHGAAGHSHSHDINTVAPQIPPKENDVENIDIGGKQSVYTVSQTDLHSQSEMSEDGSLKDIERSPESLGWMIAIGDSFHNFADGLAIGAAFSDCWQTGLGTTIAIFCHELPHEFGDVAAQLSVGWQWKRILMVQLLSQATAYLGLFIGIPVSENTAAKDWILIMTAGMFLYLALADIVPELIETFHKYKRWSIFIAANCGILLGYALMLVIAILEGVIDY